MRQQRMHIGFVMYISTLFLDLNFRIKFYIDKQSLYRSENSNPLNTLAIDVSTVTANLLIFRHGSRRPWELEKTSKRGGIFNNKEKSQCRNYSLSISTLG